MSLFKYLSPIILLAITCAASCHDKLGLYYVNPNKLLQGYHSAITQHELFQAKTQGWQQRVDSLSTELQALSKAPAAARATKEQQLLR